MRFLTSLLFLLLAVTAQATPRYWGIDHLAGGKYAKEVLAAHPKGFAIGIFTQKELFADAYPLINKLLAKGETPLVRYNLRWSDTHQFSKADFPKIVAEAKRFVPLVNKYPGAECEFSGATEHQLNAQEALALANLVLNVIPERCKYVNNPWQGRGSFIKPTDRIKNEVHGKHAGIPAVGGKFNWSADGDDVFDFDITAVKKQLSDADVFFFWASQNNGKKTEKDPTPRAQRQAWPTIELIRAEAFLATEQGNVSLPNRYLVKPKADQHMTPPEGRALKPVLIFPGNAQYLTARVGTKVIAKSEKAQPFVDGRLRYYFSTRYGYQIMREAKSNVVDIWADNKKVGTANLGFRQNEFR